MILSTSICLKMLMSYRFDLYQMFSIVSEMSLENSRLSKTIILYSNIVKL